VGGREGGGAVNFVDRNTWALVFAAGAAESLLTVGVQLSVLATLSPRFRFAGKRDEDLLR